MESLNPCCCCLLRPSEKDVKTPYVRLGVTEIFSDMMEECFQIYLAVDSECGICEECVGRLRDASDFKLQVQRSQAELLARLGRELPVKVEDPLLLSEPAPESEQCDESVLHEKVSVKIEVFEEAGPSGEFYEVPLLKPDVKSEEEILGPGRGGATHHQQKRPTYCCKVCSKLFYSKVGYNKHKHTKKESHPCKICDKVFTTNLNLTKHVGIHTEQTRYSCEICNKTFTQQDRLEGHAMTHTRQRPFSCEICNKSFTKGDHLKNHMRIHTGQKPYSCKICNKSFTEQGCLKRHIRVHTGQRPYSCKICNKSFPEPGSLTKHIRIHTGERPYSCRICNKSFTEQSHLKRHTRTHT